MRFASLLALVGLALAATPAWATPPATPRPSVVQPVRPPEVHPIQVTTAPPATIHLVTASLPRIPRPAPRSAATAPTMTAPQLFTGVRALLGSLKDRNITLGVASRRADIVGLVTKLGLGALLPAESVVASIHALADKPGADAKTTIYFGDKPEDVRAARAAGMTAVGISHGNPSTEKALHDAGASTVIMRVRSSAAGRCSEVSSASASSEASSIVCTGRPLVERANSWGRSVARRRPGVVLGRVTRGCR